MMFEVEVKIKLRDHEEIIPKLRALGAVHQYNMDHADIYYNLPNKWGDFAKTDEALRLRKTTIIDHQTGQIKSETADLTYKGPKMDAQLKTRVEYVARTSDPDKMDAIMVALGYQKVLVVEKKRKMFELTLQGYHLEILLDQVEGLDGTYLEAEIMAENKTQSDVVKQVLVEFLTKIGHSINDSITQSYLELILNKQIE